MTSRQERRRRVQAAIATFVVTLWALDWYRHGWEDALINVAWMLGFLVVLIPLLVLMDRYIDRGR